MIPICAAPEPVTAAPTDENTLELYNPASDIGEQENRAGQLLELAKRLGLKLDTWLRQTGAKMPVWGTD